MSKDINIEPYLKAIAKSIRNSGVTQKKLCEDLGVSPSTMNSMAQGQREPKLGTLLGLADALHLSLDELTGYTVPVIVHPEVTELSPEQINQMEKSLLQLHSNLSAIGNYQQNADVSKIVEYTQDCIQQILQGQKLKEEK